MKAISMWLIYSSLMGSILTIIVLLIKYIFKEKLGARWNYLIWILVLIRMIVPHGPKTFFSIFNVYHYLEKLISRDNNVNIQNIENIKEGFSRNINTGTSINASVDYALSIDTNITFIFKLFLLMWIVGVIIYSIIILTYNIKLYMKVKGERTVLNNNIIKIVDKCKNEMNIKSKIQVAQTTQFKSPVIFGIFNTFLLFPAKVINQMNYEEIEYIIRHELAHYKRKDIIINCISIILQILHWYNPIIWYAFYKMREDREVACDAYVLSYLKPEEYEKYGLTIITMLETISFESSLPIMTGFSNKRSHIKKRISMIASFNKKINEIKPWKLIVFILIACILLTNGKSMSNSSFGMEMSKTPNNSEYVDLGKYFKEYDGSFVMFNMKDSKYKIYNKTKSETRISPYSTFKIIIALTGLEHGIVENNNTKIKWNGYVYPIEPWNKDHTLSSAMQYSVNWYFEKVSNNIGMETFKEDIDKIKYGNKDLSGGITKFWNQSSLKISPIEQVDMLKKIYNYEVPFSRKNIDIVKDTIKISHRENTILSGKTGSGIINNKSINGWFIGYLEKNDNVYFFAVNIEGKDKADGAKAREIALDILKDMGIY